MDENNIGKLIFDKRTKLGLTQREIANFVGVTEATVSRWESGEIGNMRRDKIAKLAIALNLSPLAIMGLKEAPKGTNDIDGAALYNVKKVPIVGTIACGRPILATENIQGFAYTNDPAADFVLVAKGDSMEGKRIHDGDLVFIHQQEDVESGEVAAVLIDGEATLKIVHHGEGVVILSPANDKYSPRVFHEGDVESFRILGKAVKVQIDFN